MSNYNHDSFVVTGNHNVMQFVVTALYTVAFSCLHRYAFAAFWLLLFVVWSSKCWDDLSGEQMWSVRLKDCIQWQWSIACRFSWNQVHGDKC